MRSVPVLAAALALNSSALECLTRTYSAPAPKLNVAEHAPRVLHMRDGRLEPDVAA